MWELKAAENESCKTKDPLHCRFRQELSALTGGKQGTETKNLFWSNNWGKLPDCHWRDRVPTFTMSLSSCYSHLLESLCLPVWAVLAVSPLQISVRGSALHWDLHWQQPCIQSAWHGQHTCKYSQWNMAWSGETNAGHGLKISLPKHVYFHGVSKMSAPAANLR